MSHYLYIIIIIATHILSLWKLGISTSVIALLVAFLVFLAVFILHYNGFKKYPLYFRSLPFHYSSILMSIQLLFLLAFLTSGNIINLFGIIFCEIVRLYSYPEKIYEIEKEKAFHKRLNEINADFQIIRSQRHDFLKHVNVIDHLLSKDTNYDAKEYFNELLQDYKQVNLSIKGEDGHIASLLLKNYYQGTTEGIHVNYELNVPLSRLPMKNIDQIKLLGNLFDNAMEAAQKFHRTYGNATLFVKTELHGGIYILEISNSAEFVERHILDSLFKTFNISTKGETHEGLGTFVIAGLVKKYRGKLSYSYKEPELTIKIKVPVFVSVYNQPVNK